MIVANAYGTAAGSKADGYNLKNSGTAPTGAGSSSTVTFYDAGYHRANGTLASSYTYSSWTGANAGVNIGLTAPQWVAGNFQYTLTPVPEVETFALAGVGMLGLVFIGRKVVTRRTV
jgi:energy-converting hydrogenase Eha subunit G